MASETALFNILSVGQTATHWITSALRTLPGVVVGHAGELFLHILAPESMRANEDNLTIGPDKKEHNAVLRIISGFSLDQLYSLLAQHYPGKAYGIVHLFQTQSWTGRYWNSPPRNKARLFNMVRHPVPRQESLYRHWLKTARTGNPLFNQAIEEIFNNDHTQAKFMADLKRHCLDAARLEVRTWYACLGYVRYFADDLELFPRAGTIIKMEEIGGFPSEVQRG